MDLTVFGKNQSIEQHLRDQVDRYTTTDHQGNVRLNDMGILLRAALAILQGQNRWLHDEEVRSSQVLFLIWARISETKPNGMIETFEATIPVRALTADEARAKFDAYWAQKTAESGRIFTVMSADISREIS